MPLPEPVVTGDEDEFIFTWPTADDELRCLAIAVTNLRDSSGDVYAEFHVEWQSDISSGRLFGNRKANLLGVKTVDVLAALLTSKNSTAFPLDLTKLVFEQVINRTLTAWRTGEPLRWVHEASEVGAVSYAIEGILPADDSGVIYGKGDSKKGWLAVNIALNWATGGLIAGHIGVNNDGKPRVLYLDWEASERETYRRFQWMARGMGLEAVPKSVAYQRMTRSITESIAELRRITRREKFGLIVVDSLGPAAGAKLVADETAVPAMNAIRRLSPSNRLIVAHISKGERRGYNNDDTSIFGSVFFDNMARSTWKVQTDTITPDDFLIGMFHTKVNTGRKATAGLGFRLLFDEQARSATLSKGDPDQHSAAMTAVTGSVRQRMIKALAHGSMTRKDLAELLEAKMGDIRQVLYQERHRANPSFKEWDDKQVGLLAANDDLSF